MADTTTTTIIRSQVPAAGPDPTTTTPSADDDDNSNGTDATATATEQTPLLLQSSTTPSSLSSYASSTTSQTKQDNNDNDDDDDDQPNQKVGRGRAIAIILNFYVLIFLLACNMSGMTMAQSTIASELGSYDQAMWFTSSFLISFSSLSPVAGRMAGIFSPRVIVLASSVFFSLGTAITASARTFGIFILGRVVTGVGAAALMVLGLILILELTSRRRRGVFVGLLNAGMTTGVSLGAVVFGALIVRPGWRVLFWIQVPASLLAGIGVFFSLPTTLGTSSSAKTKGGDDLSITAKLKKIDYLGAFLLTSTLVLFLYSLSDEIHPYPLIASLISLLLFLAVETFLASDPIIPLSVLRSRGALLSCLAQLGFMASRWSVLFYSPIAALAVRGFPPAAAGSMLVPTNLGFGLGGLIIGAVHIKRSGSFYSSCLVCVALFAATLAAMSAVSDRTDKVPAWLYVVVLFLNGAVTGAGVNYTLAHVLHLTDPGTHYVVTSLLGTFRGFAGSFGSAIGGGIFARRLREGLEEGFGRLDDGHGHGGRAELIRKLVGSPALVYGGGLAEGEREVAIDAYIGALRTLFHAAAVLAAIVFVLQAGTGWRGPKDKIVQSDERGETSLEEEEEQGAEEQQQLLQQGNDD